jgi:hypothetical protein
MAIQECCVCWTPCRQNRKEECAWHATLHSDFCGVYICEFVGLRRLCFFPCSSWIYKSEAHAVAFAKTRVQTEFNHTPLYRVHRTPHKLPDAGGYTITFSVYDEPCVYLVYELELLKKVVTLNLSSIEVIVLLYEIFSELFQKCGECNVLSPVHIPLHAPVLWNLVCVIFCLRDSDDDRCCCAHDYIGFWQCDF